MRRAVSGFAARVRRPMPSRGSTPCPRNGSSTPRGRRRARRTKTAKLPRRKPGASSRARAGKRERGRMPTPNEGRGRQAEAVAGFFSRNASGRRIEHLVLAVSDPRLAVARERVPERDLASRDSRRRISMRGNEEVALVAERRDEMSRQSGPKEKAGSRSGSSASAPLSFQRVEGCTPAFYAGRASRHCLESPVPCSRHCELAERAWQSTPVVHEGRSPRPRCGLAMTEPRSSAPNFHPHGRDSRLMGYCGKEASPAVPPAGLAVAGLSRRSPCEILAANVPPRPGPENSRERRHFLPALAARDRCRRHHRSEIAVRDRASPVERDVSHARPGRNP